jgi:aspartate/methionine/tyrosine aminotransferase
MREAFDRRRRTMHAMLTGIDGVVCPVPEGAFYAFPSLRGLLGRPLRGRTASTTLELASLLLDEIEIAIVPGEAFGAPGYARFSFAMADHDMVEGLERLADLVHAG